MHGADATQQNGQAGRDIGSATLPAADTDWFESVYAEARGEVTGVPWAAGRPCPCLINWLNVLGPASIRPGGRVAVVGCGLGDDAAAMAARGYDVVAFDASATAVQWARRRFPSLRDSFVEADLFDLPSRLRHRFDFVAEVYTLQSLEPGRREAAAGAIASLAAPHGVILAIAHARSEDEPLDEAAGPPWLLTAQELQQAFRPAGWFPSGTIAEFDDDESPPARHLRAAFVHG